MKELKREPTTEEIRIRPRLLLYVIQTDHHLFDLEKFLLHGNLHLNADFCVRGENLRENSVEKNDIKNTFSPFPSLTSHAKLFL